MRKHQGQYLLILLMLLFAWPPVRVTCPNHEMVEFQPLTGTAPDLGSITLINITYSSHLPTNLFQPFLDLSPPPSPPDMTPIAPPFYTCRRRFALSLHTHTPTRPGAERSNRPPGWKPHPPASTALRVSMTRFFYF